jgi:hypothetical protein
MDRDEAAELCDALNAARSAFVEGIATIGRSRSMTDAMKTARVEPLRRVLATLQGFQEAHERAHGLGGY